MSVILATLAPDTLAGHARPQQWVQAINLTRGLLDILQAVHGKSKKEIFSDIYEKRLTVDLIELFGACPP
jgi:hypothetical protein